MREPSDATIDRLGDDVARLTSEDDAVWAVLDDDGIDVQLGVHTLADGVGKLARQRDAAQLHADNYAGVFNAMTSALTAYASGGSDG